MSKTSRKPSRRNSNSSDQIDSSLENCHLEHDNDENNGINYSPCKKRPRLEFRCTYPDCSKILSSNRNLQQHIRKLHSGLQIAVNEQNPNNDESTSAISTLNTNDDNSSVSESLYDSENPITSSRTSSCSTINSLSNLTPSHSPTEHILCSTYQLSPQPMHVLPPVPLKTQIFPCNITTCSHEYTSKSELQDHMSRNHPETLPKFKCHYSGCNKIFKVKYGLVKHLASHSETRVTYSCPFKDCDKIFTTREGLNYHKKTLHTSARILYPCTVPDCGKILQTKQSLEYHIQSIHSETPPAFTCPFPNCDKVFSLAHSLTRHIWTHEDTRPTFVCSNCEKVFNQSSALLRHQKKHHHPVMSPASEFGF